MINVAVCCVYLVQGHCNGVEGGEDEGGKGVPKQVWNPREQAVAIVVEPVHH